MKVVLASGSPRRKELLEMLGLEFDICPARGEEKAEPGLAPGELVKALSLAKAKEVASAYPGDTVVIAADTIVWAEGEVLGKPSDKADALRMLNMLSGKAHSVFTGICVIRGDTVLAEAEETEVHFRKLDEAEIEAYVETGEPMDKAGAYGIQGKASVLIEGIKGDYFNVMGLPLCRLGEILKTIGVQLL
ncbi:MAG: Maf family protein [Bacillota bacterium]|nr:Maf family protein [Bacillota bacterium]